MSGRTLLILLLLALGQAAYLGLARRTSPPQAQQRVLPALRPEQLTRLVIAQRQAEPTVLERRQDRWWVVAPTDAPADQQLVAQILDEAELLEPLRQLPAETSLSKLGLQEPRLRLVLEGRGGAQQSLLLGDLDPSEQGVYLAVGERLLVVPRAFGELVDRDLWALRDKRPLAQPAARLEKLALVRGKERLRLRKEGTRWLAMVGENEVWADPEQVDELLQALDQLEASRFLAPQAPLPPDEIRLVTLAQRQTLRWGEACPGAPELEQLAWQAGSWQRGCFSRADLAPLRRSLAELWDRQLLRAREAQLAQLRLASPVAEVVLRREGARWLLGSGEAADEVFLRSWLEELAAFSGQPAAPLPGPAPEAGWTLELTLESGERQDFKLGRPRGGTLPLRRSGETASLLLPAALARSLDPDPARFRSRQVLAISAAHLQRVRTRRGGQEELVARDREGGGWRVLTPVALAADVAHMTRLTRLLARLRAERLVPGAVLQPTAELTLELEAEALAPDAPQTAGGNPLRQEQPVGAKSAAPSRQRVRLELGRDADPRRCRGRVDGGQVFVLDPESCAVLQARRAARQLELPPAEQLTGLSLRGPGQELALERQGYRWASAGEPLSVVQVDELLRALAGLEVAEVAGYGALRGDPRWTVELSERGQALRALRILPDGRAALAGRQVIYRLSVESLSRLLSAFTALGPGSK